MKQKVLFVASVYVHIRNFHLPYIQGLNQRGWEVHVACDGCPDVVDGASVTMDLPFEKSFFSWKNFVVARRLRRVIRENQYDRILCHTSLAAFFTRLAVVGLCNRPAVCNMVHGYLFDDQTSLLKKTVLTLAEKFMAPVTDLVITMNVYDRSFALRHKLGKRVAYVNGVGLDAKRLGAVSATDPGIRQRLGIASTDFLLMCGAEFSPRKSQSVLIRALKLLPDDVVLCMPGQGELLDDCKELANHLGLSNRIYFPGYCSDMKPWLAAADVVVSASRSEGLPFSILEAMHYGLPVVASDVKGHQELVEDGGNGYLCPYGDAEAFAKQILRLYADRNLLKIMGARGSEAVKPYYLDAVYEEIMALYEDFSRS